jgi:hypothetical protein
MRASLRRAAAALRDFARGFLGLGAPLPADPAAARERLRRDDPTPRCC